MLEKLRHRTNPDGSVTVVFPSRPDIDSRFMTAHRSKGLQADYVFIINCRERGAGFPNRLDDSPLLSVILESKDVTPYAEERRLFYVAMTRARKGLYFVLNKNNVSSFVNEVLQSGV